MNRIKAASLIRRTLAIRGELDVLTGLDGYYALRVLDMLAGRPCEMSPLPVITREAIACLLEVMHAEYAAFQAPMVPESVFWSMGLTGGPGFVSAQVGLNRLTLLSQSKSSTPFERALAGDSLRAISAGIKVPGESLRAPPDVLLYMHTANFFGDDCIRYWVESPDESAVWFTATSDPGIAETMQEVLGAMTRHIAAKKCTRAKANKVFANVFEDACRIADGMTARAARADDTPCHSP